MSQATTWNVPAAGPGTMSAFAGRAIAAMDAILTNHSGTGRPAYAVAGTTWLKIVSGSSWELYVYDGSDDILVGTANPIANTFTLAPTGLGFATSAVCRNDVTPLSFVNGRIVALQGESGEGLIELKGKNSGSYDGSGVRWTNGSTGAALFQLLSDGATGLRLLNSGGAEALKFLATGDVTSAVWGALSEQLVPPGTIIMGAWTSAPPGYLVANGAPLPRTTYARLWAAAQARGKLVSDATWLAGAYGAFSTGDGSTNFRIPWSGGVFHRGVYDESSYMIGAFVADKLAAHGHGVTDLGHQHQVATDMRNAALAIGAGGPPTGWTINPAYGSEYKSYTAANAVTNISIQAAGSGPETMPRNITLLACVKI